MFLVRNKNTITGFVVIVVAVYLLYEISCFPQSGEEIRGIGPAFIPNVLACFLGLLGVILFLQSFFCEKEKFNISLLFFKKLVFPFIFFQVLLFI